MSKKDYSVPESDDDEENFSEDLESEEEYTENELSEEEDVQGNRKRKRPAHGGFILDEAEVEEDYESEESEVEEGLDELIEQQRLRQKREREKNEAKRRAFAHINDEKHLEELVAHYEGRADDSKAGSAIEKQRHLPGVNNPYLWMVRCQAGEERRLAFLLMRKALKCVSKRDPLNIKSVIQLDRLRGFVYVEAYKATHVKRAIEGIYGFRFGMYNQKMVPIEEMTDVLRVVSTTPEVRPNSFVRFKRGLYRGDLALVIAYDGVKGVATLKMIPRIDYTSLVNRAKLRMRPVAALFDPEKARASSADVLTEGGFLVVRGRRFKNGFLIKRVHVSSLIVEDVVPSLGEVSRFNISPESVGLSGQVPQVQVAVGDVVRIVEGELTNLIGLVTSVTPETVVVKPEHSELTDPIQFGHHELVKHFKVGDHVRVLRGQYKGESGLIVRARDDQVVVLSDFSIKELEVFSRDVQLCSEKTVGYDDSGQFTIHDFVQLDSQTIGVAVSVEPDSVSVLDQFGIVRRLKPQTLAKKRLFGGMFIDQFNNKITVGDTVRVIEGRHRGMRGQFKYFYRGFVFAFSKTLSENANMFVARSKNLVLDSDHPQAQGYVGLGRSPTAKRNKDLSRDKGLIGSTVRVIRGPYKGYIGIVKDSTSVLARVELHTNSKTINVDRSNITVCGGVSRPIPRPRLVSASLKTPDKAVGAQTPSYESSRTPRYGGQTPAHDGSATPVHSGSVWDPTSTPGQFDDLGSEIIHSDIIMALSDRPRLQSLNIDNIETPTSVSAPLFSVTPSPISPNFPLPTPSPNVTSTTDGETPTTSQNDVSFEVSPAIVPLELLFSLEPGNEMLVSQQCELHDVAGKYVTVFDVSDPQSVLVKTLNVDRALDSCSVVLSVNRSFLSPAPPVIGRNVAIAYLDKFLHGTLIGIDQDDGIVELSDASKEHYACDDEVSLFLLRNIISRVPVS